MDKGFDAATLAALRGEVGSDGLKMLVGLFIEELNEFLTHFSTMPDQYDFARMEVDCHTMVSSARSMGMMLLADICRDMELAAMKGSHELFSSKVPLVIVAGNHALRSLKGFTD